MPTPVEAAALADGADTFVTSGAAQCNHARLTAAAAARQGVRAVLVLVGVPAPDATGNISLDSLFGARPAVSPLGGSNAVGARGYVDCAAELAAGLDTWSDRGSAAPGPQASRSVPSPE